jgi:hypothetical protein
LLNLFIHPFDFGVANGNAFFIYSFQKSVLMGDKLACPLMDPIVLKKGGNSQVYVTIGSLPQDEVISSFHLSRTINPLEFILSCLFLRGVDFKNYQFLNLLYESPMLCMLKSGGRWHERRWFQRYMALRNFLIAHYFSLKFRELAIRCDGAYVLVYYNAIMLGVICAFRKLGKGAWDVQHGYLGPDHDAYSNTRAFAIDSTFKPTGFLVWDNRFGAHIESTLKLPWENTNHLTVQHDLSQNKYSGHFTVLYTLQWGTSIPDVVQEAVRNSVDIQWVFRKHPFDNSLRSDLNWLQQMPNCSISDSSESLVAALSRCNLHITFNSGAAHEAAALGIQSIFLDKEFAIRVDYEIRQGMAIFASDQSLIGAIRHAFEAAEFSISDASVK